MRGYQTNIFFRARIILSRIIWKQIEESMKFSELDMDDHNPGELDVMRNVVRVFTSLRAASYTLVCPYCNSLVQTYIYYKRRRRTVTLALCLLFFLLWIFSCLYCYHSLTSFHDFGSFSVRYFYNLFSDFVKSLFVNIVIFASLLFTLYKALNSFSPYYLCLQCQSTIAKFGQTGSFEFLIVDSNFNKPISFSPNLVPRILCYFVFALYVGALSVLTFYWFY